jgi:MFS family permease
VIGTWLATIAAIAVGSQWRYAYLIGVLPALLIVWVRFSVKEPKQWQDAENARIAGKGGKRGSFKELLTVSPWAKNAFLAMGMAAVGLGTFWAVTIAGQDLAREALQKEGFSAEDVASKSKFAYGIVQTIGGGLGLLSFGMIAARIGRRKTFILYHVAALIIVPITCFVPQSYQSLLVILPFFGFFTLGMHAGYAVYFPELFPNRLRATGTSWGFNGGRILAVSVLYFSGWLKSQEGMQLSHALMYLSALFAVGVVLVLFMPETRGKELPE